IGQDTLGIYVIQTILLETLMAKYIAINTHEYVFSLIIAPLLSIVILLACELIIILIRKSRILRLLFLGERV
ncbi:MAG: hypothetical protein K2H85_01040, partial [Allobaculum sp.]|nr:hypothetical protein [Allobaculum sp.]